MLRWHAVVSWVCVHLGLEPFEHVAESCSMDRWGGRGGRALARLHALHACLHPGWMDGARIIHAPRLLRSVAVQQPVYIMFPALPLCFGCAVARSDHVGAGHA